MSVTTLRGRFVARDGDLYNPVVIISESNVLCGFGGRQYQCRDFFSLTEHCSSSGNRGYTDKETAIKCIEEAFEGMKDSRGEISDSYRRFPKTARGFSDGFFKREFAREEYERYYPDSAYFFERHKL